MYYLVMYMCLLLLFVQNLLCELVIRSLHADVILPLLILLNKLYLLFYMFVYIVVPVVWHCTAIKAVWNNLLLPQFNQICSGISPT